MATEAAAFEQSNEEPIGRRIIAEDPKWTLSTVPMLAELQLKDIVKNFKKQPILNELPTEKQKKSVLESLPVTLPLKVTANLIDDENYWKRVSRSRWPLITFERKNQTWKQLFFENHFKNICEFYLPQEDEDETKAKGGVERPKNTFDIIQLAKLTKDYIYQLDIDQLLPSATNDQNNDHLNFEKILPHLTNLQSLKLTYQVKNCGMNFEWRLFDFTENDCHTLSKGILALKNSLSSITLTRSSLKDNLCRTFCAYMLKHNNLTHLDLSRNEIGDRGARGIAKLMFTLPGLKTVKLGDNRINNDGIKALGAALSKSSCQTEELDLQINSFSDEAASFLISALKSNTKLKKLNLASNQINELSIEQLCLVLTNNTNLESLDFSGNEFGVQVGRVLQEGLENNKSIKEINIKLTGTGAENEYTIQNIVANNKSESEKNLA